MAPSPSIEDRLAAPPRVPAPTPALEKAEHERQNYLHSREGVERRSVLRGLIVLAVIVLLFSLWRAGADRVLVGRWWWP